MEFNSRKGFKADRDIHHNPYILGGNHFLNRFHKRELSKMPDITPPKRSFASSRHSYKMQHVPPRKLGLLNSPNQENKISLSSKLKYDSSSHILQNSQFQNSVKENACLNSKWISKRDIYHSLKKRKDFGDSTNNRKRHLIKDSSLQDSFSAFSDEENDELIPLSNKHDKVLKDIDKENNNLISYPSKYSKVDASITLRKKLVNLEKSTFPDFSHHKTKLYGISDKRNTIRESGLNLKQIEEKENLSIKKEDLSSLEVKYPHKIGFPNFGNTCYLNAVLQTLVSLQPFVVDLCNVVEKGVPKGSVTHSLWNVIAARQKLDSYVLKPSLRTLKESVEKIDGSFSGFKMQDANEFLTQVLDMVKDEISKFSQHNSVINHSLNNSQNTTVKTLLYQNPVGIVLSKNTTKKQEMGSCTNIFSSQSPSNKHGSIFDTPSSSSPVSLETQIKENGELVADNENLFILPEQSLNGDTVALINPVICNFEFELLESFRCLGCGESEGRLQKHFALYVDLPKDGDESIQNAVEVYMREDQRDLTCEKCKHKKASFLTSFRQLPRFLIVQIKRYEYKPQQNECIKVSSKVDVNMWLHLDKLTSMDTRLPPNFVEDSVEKELNYNGLHCPSHHANRIATSVDSKEASKDFVSTSNSNFKTPKKVKEDKKLEEVIVHSLEEVRDANQSIENGIDKEEEDFQQAIKLSLQDTGLCFSNDKPMEEETELPSQKVGHSAAEQSNGIHSYHLVSIISHHGLTTCTGHYVSDVLHIRDSEWHHYDDEQVSTPPESVVLSEGRQKNGYIFFYIHRDIYHALAKKT